MTGDKSKFLSLESFNGGNVIMGDNSKCKIIGKGEVGNGTFTLTNVLYVDNLRHNLISISQLCDKGMNVFFDSNTCKIIDKSSNNIVFTGKRKGNVYTLSFDNLTLSRCLVATDEEAFLWHRRLGHASMGLLEKLETKELVRGLPHQKFKNNKVCKACSLGKLSRSSFPPKNIVSTSRVLELIHMDLFGPNDIASLNGKRYCYVLVDDYSRFTWVYFLAKKSEAFEYFSKFTKLVQNEKGVSIKTLRSDHGGEFENLEFESFCEENGFKHEFSAPRTPQQNGVVERKNRTLQELARSMLSEYKLPLTFWAEAVNTSCYVINRVMIRPILNKTSYDF